MTFAIRSTERSPEHTGNVLGGRSREHTQNVRRVFAFPVPSRPVPSQTHTRPAPLQKVFGTYLNDNNSRHYCRSGHARGAA